MKKFSLAFLLVLAMLVLAACGGGSPEEDPTTDDAADNGGSGEDVLAKVKEEGTLVIGTEGTYPPFTFHDASGELTGFDVEIAREVAERLGVEAEFLETQWDAMFAGLDAGRFDMVANQVGINPERQESYEFSDPYITSTAVLVVAEDNTEIQSFEDLDGKLSAQSLTSNYAETATSYGAELEGVEGFNQAIELLNSGRVDATVNDNLTVLDFLKQRPDAKVKVVDESGDAAQSALLFRKDSGAIVDEANKALADMIEDGTYDEISEKWFGENVLE
ncbi:amino acid ABC transporter substrate-binding protein [Microbacterium sp. APC 3898]|uniref:Amino acid ABC transporter substrate-binding protein n=1 Tax=Planococcus notacanthi TaxID=3035188 RepID=A0ABT7ZKY1_9BACL|nr:MULTISPECIES: amino acid ABC transporter substrate-binding protein [Terrabacteria group]MDN3427810.1 amino acid ABC transporter substrate-binding protein [Planococcus sp. APC 4016]MDN3437164.1 amino acid ABC transporter substrate-binding protein [Planococcus sp. APC 3900]MDN3499362.1 amino acid ABC transporter substrate-binding protein [Microbacterium sp. APC 3898]